MIELPTVTRDIFTWGLFSITTWGLSPLVNLRMMMSGVWGHLVRRKLYSWVGASWWSSHAMVLIVRLWEPFEGFCCHLMMMMLWCWWSGCAGIILDISSVLWWWWLFVGTFWGRSSAVSVPFHCRSGQAGGSREGFQELLDARTPSGQSRRQG